MVAALESITLLSWLHTDSSPVLHRSQIASRATSCTSAMTSFRRWSWSLCLAQLTPACGVASMPIHPGCHRPFHHFCRSSLVCLCCSCGESVLFGSLFKKLADFDFIASACLHSVRHRSPALHPVFTQLVPTAFEEGMGFEPTFCAVRYLALPCLASRPSFQICLS